MERVILRICKSCLFRVPSPWHIYWLPKVHELSLATDGGFCSLQRMLACVWLLIWLHEWCWRIMKWVGPEMCNEKVATTYYQPFSVKSKWPCAHLGCQTRLQIGLFSPSFPGVIDPPLTLCLAIREVSIGIYSSSKDTLTHVVLVYTKMWICGFNRTHFGNIAFVPRMEWQINYHVMCDQISGYRLHECWTVIYNVGWT